MRTGIFFWGGINNGFKIVDFEQPGIKAEMHNYKLTDLHHEAVEAQIKAEIAEHRYIITAEKPKLVSALNVVTKPSGGIRLIHDCSQPAGAAVNDYVSLHTKVRYQTIQNAVDLIKPGSYMAKINLKSAYRSVHLHPSQYAFTGFKWKFKNNDHFTYLYDTALPFGSRKSPSIFHRLSQSVRRMMKRRGYDIVVYLDDFLIVESSFERCLEAMNVLLRLLRQLGFSIAWDKVTGPTQNIIFLGIVIDTVNMILALPEHKVHELLQLLLSYKSKRRASLKQLQKLAGKLVWACSVVRGGRSFLQRILNTLRPLKIPTHKAKLDIEFQRDIDWWVQCISAFNKKAICPLKREIICVFTDASNEGAGMICDNDWSYINWVRDAAFASAKHINIKETLSAISAVYKWAHKFRNKHIIIYTDSMTTRAILNKGAARESFIMYHLRNVFWLSVLYDFTIECKHIAGTTNIFADSVSRLHECGHRLHWFSITSGGRPFSIAHIEDDWSKNMSNNSLKFLIDRSRRRKNLGRQDSTLPVALLC